MLFDAGSFDDALRDLAAERLGVFERAALPLDGRHAAAVAVTLVADTERRPCFVLTRRAAKLSRHAGQWALPGGRLDPGETATDAALRELHEEVGLALAPGAVLGLLDDYATRSGYVITPVVVWGGADAVLERDPREVAAVHRIQLADLFRPEVPRLRQIPQSERPVLSIPLHVADVHAPTAAIVYQLREVVLRGLATRVAHYEQPVFAWK
jgi:8-oxo-dGTP pyrophosphatase MutT (NUDIX family)